MSGLSTLLAELDARPRSPAAQAAWEAAKADMEADYQSAYAELVANLMADGIIAAPMKGGPGSGHFDHAGRPGQRGGSKPSEYGSDDDTIVFGDESAAASNGSNDEGSLQQGVFDPYDLFDRPAELAALLSPMRSDTPEGKVQERKRDAGVQAFAAAAVRHGITPLEFVRRIDAVVPLSSRGSRSSYVESLMESHARQFLKEHAGSLPLPVLSDHIAQWAIAINPVIPYVHSDRVFDASIWERYADTATLQDFDAAIRTLASGGFAPVVPERLLENAASRWVKTLQITDGVSLERALAQTPLTIQARRAVIGAMGGALDARTTLRVATPTSDEKRLVNVFRNPSDFSSAYARAVGRSFARAVADYIYDPQEAVAKMAPLLSADSLDVATNNPHFWIELAETSTTLREMVWAGSMIYPHVAPIDPGRPDIYTIDDATLDAALVRVQDRLLEHATKNGNHFYVISDAVRSASVGESPQAGYSQRRQDMYDVPFWDEQLLDRALQMGMTDVRKQDVVRAMAQRGVVRRIGEGGVVEWHAFKRKGLDGFVPSADLQALRQSIVLDDVMMTPDIRREMKSPDESSSVLSVRDGRLRLPKEEFLAILRQTPAPKSHSGFGRMLGTVRMHYGIYGDTAYQLMADAGILGAGPDHQKLDLTQAIDVSGYFLKEIKPEWIDPDLPFDRQAAKTRLIEEYGKVDIWGGDSIESGFPDALAAMIAPRVDLASVDQTTAATLRENLPDDALDALTPDTRAVLEAGALGELKRRRHTTVDARTGEVVKEFDGQDAFDRWLLSFTRRNKGDGERGAQKDTIVATIAAATGETYEDMNTLVAQWAKTSNARDMRSLSIHVAAAQEFGNMGVTLSEWQQDQVDRPKVKEPLLLDKRIKDPDERMQASISRIRNVLRSMYDTTQAELAAAGVTQMRIYRGVKIKKAEMQSDFTPWRVGDVVQFDENALSSWTTDIEVARRFGNAVFSTVVPATQIFCTARTGFGCLNEQEVLLMAQAGHMSARVERTKNKVKPLAVEEWAQNSPPIKGGPGSGNFGHAGRPGKRGGSAPRTATYTREQLEKARARWIDDDEILTQMATSHYEIADENRPIYDRVMALETEDVRKTMRELGLTPDEVYARIAKARRQIDDAFAAGANNNQGRKGRSALYDQIIKDAFEGKTVPEEPVFLITGGLPGAGKSSMLKNPIYADRLANFVRIESDTVKEVLAKADGIPKLTWEAVLYKEESYDVAMSIMQRAISGGYNVVFDNTMRFRGQTIRLMERVKERGYRTEVALIDVPVETAASRAITRFLRGGRFVDPAAVVSSAGRPQTTYEAVRSMADVSRRWDNRKIGSNPVLIEELENGD